MGPPTWLDIILGLLPLLILLGAFYLILRVALFGARSPHTKMIELARRQTEALERIADALEKRAP